MGHAGEVVAPTAATTSTTTTTTTSPTFIRAHIDLQAQDNSSIQTIPQLIEHNADRNPDHSFCLQAQKETKDAPAQILSVSHTVLKRSILHCQEVLIESILALELPSSSSDGSIHKGSPVALLLESDIGLLIHLFALVGLGVPCLLLSARLSPAAIHHLLQKTKTSAIIVSPRLESLATEAISAFSLTDTLPQKCLQNSYPSYLSPQINGKVISGSICKPGYYIQENDRNVAILHSSGTTGLPKPIYQSHKYLLTFATCHEFNDEEELLGTSLSTLPLYHGYGLTSPLLSLGIGKTFCVPPASIVPNGRYIVDLVHASEARSLVSVPSVLEDIATMPHDEGIKALAHLQFVSFGGGPLKSSVGDRLVAGGVRVLNHYGATEIGGVAPFYVPTPDYNWHYFRLRRDMNLWLEKGPTLEDGIPSHTLVTRPFGWEEDFVFQDQLICNPEKPETEFQCIGRTDDIIVLATGEKANPRVLESMLFDSPIVTAAVAFGDGQFELGIIIQPSSSLAAADVEQFKDSIWPVIQQANEKMDAHARVSSNEAIIVVPSDVKFPRSDKGSIMRKEAHRMLETEILAVYQALDNQLSDVTVAKLDMEDLEAGLKNLVQDRLTWRLKAEQWTVDDDLFELGMDSLQAVQLRRFILSSLPDTASSLSRTERVPNDIIYRNPTITQLAQALKTTAELPLGEDSIDDFVEQLCLKCDVRRTEVEAPSVVLMTGGTGSLGSHVLAHLASLPHVRRVICLNRPSSNQDGHDRQLKALKSKQIDLDAHTWSKVEIHECNTSLPHLGLHEEVYAHLTKEVTHILHNAWPVDFKRQLPSFRSHFQALQNLLELSRYAAIVQPLTRPKLLFVSSIATVGQYPLIKNETLVPETPMISEDYSNSIGYAKAKLVCERIVERAAHDLSGHIEASSIRIGQMSGSSKAGYWNSDEHLPALFKSSRAIGSLPDLHGTLAWIPVDVAAETISDVLLSTAPAKAIYHLENPVRQSWHDVLQMIAPELGLSSAEFIPLASWLDRVRRMPDLASDKMPVKKLEDFFRRDFEHMACGSVVLDTKNTRDLSSTLRKLSHFPKELFGSYVRYWKASGYIN
ncbi:MAG: putative NRPS-like protein biosynthetic cluster [Ramalina farinacea]|uniref:NRPS-like protein biosynthetic cluster n=1 Tax=Ramalina farinacea TaxID=258253 RepID=A0AA43QHM8_9LECA|nr:putative NRPS-like protein biosynthetic cluster [Ramalina farinacea]